MLAIFKDASARPELFYWFGAIAHDEIESWLKLSGLTVPDGVRELWTVTGGGDLFDEGETIFRPTAVPSSEPHFIASSDFVDPVNEHCIKSGMSKNHFAFHDGSFFSAIRLTDQRIVTLDEKWQETRVFSDLDDWYRLTLREAYADVYDFPRDSR